MRKLLLLLTATIGICCSGCVIMPSGAEYSYDIQPNIFPDDSSGVVYFMRENEFTGGGRGWFISEGNKKIGVVRGGTYFIHKTTPGKHSYIVDTHATSVVTIDVEAGKKYYLLSWVTVPVFVGTIRWHQKEIPASVANELLPKLKYIYTTFTK